MQVVKRSGSREQVKFDKITARIKKQCYGLDKSVDPVDIAMKVIAGLYDGITTDELDTLAAETAAMLTVKHPDFATLAARIAVTNHHKKTKKSFSETIKDLHEYINPITKKHAPLISDEIFKIVQENAIVLDSAIIYDRDFNFDYFGFKTLEKSYFLRLYDRPVERPQHLWMRVAVGIHGEDINSVIETYNLMSQGYFTHATPTLFNAGTTRPQLSSCFLLTMKDDSVEGIYDTLKQTALISKYAGGIGLSIHNIRAKGSYIEKTNGFSNGLLPMLKQFNETACYIDQCFVPGTTIYTKLGVKPIELVTKEDEVLTHEGIYKPIVNVKEFDYKGSVVKLKVAKSFESIKVTDEHLFYALKDHKVGKNFNEIKNSLDLNLSGLDWYSAKDLSVGDFLVFPLSKYEKDLPEFSEDDCRFLGIMLGDGSVSGEYNTTANISIGQSKKDRDMLSFIEKYLTSKSVNYTIGTQKGYHDDSVTKVRFQITKLPFTLDDIYANKDKYINEKFLHLPKKKSLKLIQGLLDSDGNVNNKDGKEVVLYSSSENLINSVRFILNRFGIATSGYVRNKINQTNYLTNGKKITTKKLAYCLRITKDEDLCDVLQIKKSKFLASFVHNGYLYTRVKSLEIQQYDGKVYDFEVKDIHSYVVNQAGVVHNGGGKRKGSFAIYLEPWHADIFTFLDLRKNQGKDEIRARDLFYALWIPDLFMKKVENDEDWALMCPHECPGLADAVGEEFENLYNKYVEEGRPKQIVKARSLWFQIIGTRVETGMPYLTYKDAANRKSNQKNLGTIRSSNLCAEIIEYTSPEEVAVCNLASIALPKYVINNKFDFEKLYEVTYQVTKNLDKVIDVNFYPVPEAKRSNMRHRPIGIGVQGLADAYLSLKLAFDSDDAKKLNKEIFETIYYAFLNASCDLAKIHGTYETYEGSPLSEGKLQFDLWAEENKLFNREKDFNPSSRWDWGKLREKIKKYGVRNSLGIAQMPTGSTSQILGNSECIEPYTSNLFTRKVLAGEFIVINKHLVKELSELGLWSDEMRMKIIDNDGSVQHIDSIPNHIRARYKTVWEISQKVLIDQAADRGAYICQSQSMNLYVKDPNTAKISSMDFHAWKSGLKTGSYYMKVPPSREATKFSQISESLNSTQNTPELLYSDMVCSLDNPGDCMSCGS